MSGNAALTISILGWLSVGCLLLPRQPAQHDHPYEGFVVVGYLIAAIATLILVANVLIRG
jgi:hypothetical protein